MLKSRLPELMEKKGIKTINDLVKECIRKNLDISRKPLDKLYTNNNIESTKLETIVKLMNFFELEKIDEIVYKED